MEDLRKQAERFGTDIRNAIAIKADLSERPYKITFDNDSTVETDALIVATGPRLNTWDWKMKKICRYGCQCLCHLRRVLFTVKTVAVVGGGDTACEEATYLAGLAAKVYLLVRKPFLPPSKIMQERVLENPKIEVLFEHNAEGLFGENRWKAYTW